MQNVVPTMAALKHVLERAHSPLLGALMASLGVILKDYRSEIEDILSSNRQLAAELEFDLRQQESKEEEEAAATVAAATSAPPNLVRQSISNTCGTAATPNKDSPQTKTDLSAMAAPGSVLKSGLPACFLSPAAKGLRLAATPLSIPRLAKAQALSLDGAAPGEKARGGTRAARARRRSGNEEDTENIPVQLS